MTGTGILLAAIVAGPADGLLGRSALLRDYCRTLWVVRYSLLTIAPMLALGYVTRYSGSTPRMGLAFAETGGCIRSSAPCSAGSAWR